MMNFKLWLIPIVFALSACSGGGSSDGDGDLPSGVTIPKKISWTRPTQNTDESDFTDLTKYRFYYGPDESSLSPVPGLDMNFDPPKNPSIGEGPASVTIVELTDEEITIIKDLIKSNKTHYFAMTAFNSQEIESSLSNIEKWPPE